jgi:hypothetical protein
MSVVRQLIVRPRPGQVLDEQLLGLILREPERERIWRRSLSAATR